MHLISKNKEKYIRNSAHRYKLLCATNKISIIPLTKVVFLSTGQPHAQEEKMGLVRINSQTRALGFFLFLFLLNVTKHVLCMFRGLSTLGLVLNAHFCQLIFPKEELC
ncbi:hypothetical protein HPP92_024217 [Vanilla planifolia]|uniref:Uncharacterized protein n=1 Tax=Vanilla planifolia TaxID=51239 RepID=A0A835PJ94_VANPL|nr:hypothetical protein HPP92_024217 [Vanilla planifolia]